MKLKHIFILAALLLVAAETFSQEDIRREIMNYQESEFTFVNKARRLLGTHIKDGNIIEAAKVRDTLLDEFNRKIDEAFYDSEYIHLLFALREYEQLSVFMQLFDINQKVSQNVYTSAQTDNLGTILRENSLQYKDIISIDIKENVDNEMERAFLILLLSEISHHFNSQAEREEHTEIINKLANEYLANYPDSPFDKVVRDNIRFEYGEANWGVYWDFGVGFGINERGLKNTIGNTGFGMEMIVEYRYKKMLAQFDMSFVNSRLQRDVDINNTTWYKDASSSLGSFVLNAGYLVFENKRWSLYPLAGVGFASITASIDDTKEDPMLKKLKLNTFHSQVGMGVDFKLLMPGKPKNPIGRVSLKYKYKIYNFEKTNPLFEVNQHTVSLTYGIGGRPLERKK